MSGKKCVSLENSDWYELFFECVKVGKLSDGTSVKKMLISVLCSGDGTTCPLWVPTDTCFSPGIKKDFEHGDYYIPLIFMGKNSSTERQKEFVKVIKEIRSACGEPISELSSYDEGGFAMNVKLRYDEESEKILTRFYERKTMEDKDSIKEITPEKYIGEKSCVARAIIEISSVFVARETTLQMKAITIILSESESESRKRSVSPIDEI